MPSENAQNRRLAAILFADIVGYTALMQTDEKKANTLLDKFLQTINTEIAKHNGQVINNYGDGCVCIFESAVSAIYCAKEIQSQFQSDPIVPVRIGLHSGDVFFKEDNVFGDSVNIASRIESMGVPGAVLISKRVRDVVKNQSDLLLPSLGSFEFKNVEEPIEVFALANEGFIVPKKEQITGKFKEQPKKSSTSLLKYLIPLAAITVIGLGVWKWGSGSNGSMSLNASDVLEPINTPLSKLERDKRVAVMVFDNKTGSEELEDFGTMISDWVTKGLMETEEADVISTTNIQNNIATASLGKTELNQFSQSTGVGIVLQGNYYLQEDDIIIHAEVVDTETGEILHALDRIQGPRSNMIDLLDQLTDEILGFWSIKSNKRYLKNPPKYEAYQKYMQAYTVWGEQEHLDRIEQLLTESITIDPDFHEAALKLAVHYGNRNRYVVKRDSLLDVLSRKTNNMSKWEKLRYEQIMAGENMEWQKGAEICEKMYGMDQSDYASNYNAGNYYVRANMPRHAIDIMTKMDYKFRGLEIRKMSMFEPRLSEAYYMVGEYENSIKVAKEYPFEWMRDDVAALHLRSLIRLDSIHLIEPVIDHYKERGTYMSNGGKRGIGKLYEYVCNESYQLGKHVLLDKYIAKLKEWNAGNIDNRNFNHFNGLIHYFKNDYKIAATHFEKDFEGFGSYGYILALSRVGSCLGRTGDTASALAYKSKIIERDKENQSQKLVDESFSSLSFYCMARVDANLGNIEAALENLSIAYKKGAHFYPEYWQYDSFLKPLFDNAEFREMVRPKD